MKTIQIQSSLSTNILSDFNSVKAIEIENNPIAEGAFGEVYICNSINGKTPSIPQVIKFFKEDNNNRQDHNFNTVQKLQRKIDSKNQQIKRATGKKVTEEYPALNGIPQFSFEGQINGKKYRGFSSNNLKKLGYEEFIDILDKPNLYKSYQKISIDKKMLIAFHLVSGFKLLQEIFFIHADLKPEAIFINTKTNECAIIDYDSGTITENPNDTPNTWGAPNDWVAPEIWEQLKQIGSSGLQQVKVNLLSDLWSVAVGIHYILTTTHPLFYLNELSPRVIKQYFYKYKWPEIQETETYFNQRNTTIYIPVKNWLEKKLPNQIYTQLYNTVNYGYLNPIKRTTYNEWEKVLSSVQEPPEIQKFSFDALKVLSGNKVNLEWRVINSTNTKISSLGSVKSTDKIEITLPKTTTFNLIAENSFGKIEQKISIKVLPLPKISEFKTTNQKIEYGRETSLIWSVENAVKTELSYNGILETLSFINEKKVQIEKNTTFKLIVTALDGKTTIERELTVKVFKRVKINSFQSNLDFVVESLPITLSWEVENASKLILTSNFQPDIDVTGKTDLKLKPKRNTVLFLKASNDLFSAQERIEIEVQALPSMPRIQNIIPNSKELIPTFNLDFQNISDSILSKSELNFEKTMKPINGFSLKSTISKIFKTNRKNGI